MKESTNRHHEPESLLVLDVEAKLTQTQFTVRFTTLRKLRSCFHLRLGVDAGVETP